MQESTFVAHDTVPLMTAAWVLIRVKGVRTRFAMFRFLTPLISLVIRPSAGTPRKSYGFPSARSAKNKDAT
jgi:hypothetical protein